MLAILEIFRLQVQPAEGQLLPIGMKFGGEIGTMRTRHAVIIIAGVTAWTQKRRPEIVVVDSMID